MQDRSPTTRQNPLATHGRTIHLGHLLHGFHLVVEASPEKVMIERRQQDAGTCDFVCCANERFHAVIGLTHRMEEKSNISCITGDAAEMFDDGSSLVADAVLDLAGTGVTVHSTDLMRCPPFGRYEPQTRHDDRTPSEVRVWTQFVGPQGHFLLC